MPPENRQLSGIIRSCGGKRVNPVPGGRPKGHGDLRELARQYTEDALKALVEICRNGENEGARVAAANAILDRGWGKPTMAVVTCDPPEVITLDFGFRQSQVPFVTPVQPVAPLGRIAAQNPVGEGVSPSLSSKNRAQ